jgi:hypothetical protein
MRRGGDRAAIGKVFINEVNKVPGPLPLLGIGAAFGFSRKLRKRINGRSLPVARTIA